MRAHLKPKADLSSLKKGDMVRHVEPQACGKVGTFLSLSPNGKNARVCWYDVDPSSMPSCGATIAAHLIAPTGERNRFFEIADGWGKTL
jgi:hypothetical protein